MKPKATKGTQATKIILALLLASLAIACTSTITPKKVVTTQIGFDGTNQNAGVVHGDDGRYYITEKKRLEYNALVAIYPRGIEFHPILIPLIADAGLTIRRMESGVQTWYIDQEHLVLFLLMNGWAKEGKKPR